MADFFRSDEHLGHDNILRLCNRPFKSKEEMHEVIIERHNERVSPSDRVFFLGDVTHRAQASRIRPLLHRMNGSKILIRGNHDKEKSTPLDCFEQVVHRMEYELPTGHKVLLCHYPYKGTPEEIDHAAANGYQIRYLEQRPDEKGQWLLHGHVHGMWKTRRRMINVGVDVWDFYPVSLDQILEIINGTR